jgi:hypothetical protein
MILLRKKTATDNIKDFRPISLIHSFSKLITKVLALHLTPHMNNLVLPNQSAFIPNRAIHDNFMVMCNTLKLLHVRHHSSFLLKVDIAKAFDTVGWSFLLDLLAHLGCSQRWADWVSVMLSTASTRIILNGVPGHHICDECGLQ